MWLCNLIALIEILLQLVINFKLPAKKILIKTFHIVFKFYDSVSNFSDDEGGDKKRNMLRDNEEKKAKDKNKSLAKEKEGSRKSNSSKDSSGSSKDTR